jgi:very-short-patch-repair endonuclease
LVIEIDGDTHAGRETTDVDRSRWLLEQKNYRVIRFTNRDVLECTEAVIEEIRVALQASTCGPPTGEGKSLYHCENHIPKNHILLG